MQIIRRYKLIKIRKNISMSNNLKISIELWGAILCLTFLVFILIGEKMNVKRTRALLFLVLDTTILLLSDATAVFFRGNETMLGYYAVRISNYLCFVMVCAVEHTAAQYLNALLISEGQKPIKMTKYIIDIPCLITFFYITISQFTGFMYTFDEHNRYHRAGGVVYFAVISVLLIIIIIVLIAKNLRKVKLIQSVPLLLTFVLVFAADIAQWMFYGTSLAYISLALGMEILFTAYEKEKAYQHAERNAALLQQSLTIAQQEKELMKKEAQLTEQRTQLTLSQIQPHFLYNTLAAISFLCVKDPKKAKETTDLFAKYLRNNLNGLLRERMVTFEQELTAVETYLAIEKTRFGDDLEIEYEIGYTNFLLPTLSLQPIVENAVRHGVCKKEDGGKIVIRSEKEENNINIYVIDDGAGFEPSAANEDGKRHIGLRNVGERLSILCHGMLSIESAPGKGTCVKISIPCPEA